MRTTLLAFLLSISFSYAQHFTSRVEVMDRLDIESSTTFSGNASGISFLLLHKTVNDSSYKVVGINVLSKMEQTVGKQRGVAIDGNLNVSLGASRITQTRVSDEYIELDSASFKELYDFINWSFRQMNPAQQREVALMYQMDNGLKMALNYNNKEWTYYFKIADAEFNIPFAEGMEIIKKLGKYQVELSEA